MSRRTPRLISLIFITFICITFFSGTLWEYYQQRNTHLSVSNATPVPHVLVHKENDGPGAIQWKLIFDDEFDGTSLDPKKWNIEDMAAGGYHHCCLTYGVQYYTPQALSLQQGSLQITTQSQDVNGYNGRLHAFTTYHYTSGAITTENKLNFQYGRIDIRAKLPETQGFWPAIWMLPAGSVAGIAPYEIDIMEMLGQEPTTIHMVNHWGKQQNALDFSGPDFSQDYHEFSIIWTSKSISWYIDGVQRFESERGIPDQSMYLIINSTLGGQWAGNPDESTVLPQYMDIDYVRIYQQASQN